MGIIQKVEMHDGKHGIKITFTQGVPDAEFTGIITRINEVLTKHLQSQGPKIEKPKNIKKQDKTVEIIILAKTKDNKDVDWKIKELSAILKRF